MEVHACPLPSVLGPCRHLPSQHPHIENVCTLGLCAACLTLSYPDLAGSVDQPFWNMLSINPILHQGHLMLYMAHLKDYSYQIQQLVSLSPSQFCRSAENHQRSRHLEALQFRLLGKPAIYEADESVPIQSCSPPSRCPVVKKLGWRNLDLEPEHLIDRVADALKQLDATYDITDNSESSSDLFMINVLRSGVAFRVIVTEDNAEGAYSITCNRMSGDTFEFHKSYRELRELLAAAVAPVGASNDSKRPCLGLAGAPGLVNTSREAGDAAGHKGIALAEPLCRS